MSVRIRSGYSFRVAYGRIPDVIKTLKEKGFSYAPITDTGSAFAWNRWSKEAKKAELKPVFGVELSVTNSIMEKKPRSDAWTFLAKNSMLSLNNLIGVATRQFRYIPLLTYQQAMAAEDVFRIVGRRPDLSLVEPDGRTYLAAAPSTPLPVLRRAAAAGLPLAAASENYYPTPDDEGAYSIALGRDAQTQTYPMHILSDDEWRTYMYEQVGLSLDACNKAIENRDFIFGECKATLQQGSLLVPIDPEPLRDICERQAPELGIDLGNQKYRQRLERELTLIKEKDFEDYFHIVGDLVRWARKNMTVGPARGSSCGSLVCYLLGITTVDPLKYDLLFERFIDATRSDLPDIDIDFAHSRRDLAFNYLEEKYGSDRVARLGTVNRFAAASAINAAGIALKIPKAETAPVVDAIQKRFSGDSRALDTLKDALTSSVTGKKLIAEHPEFMHATKLEGHPTHAGQHAAGMILTQIPINNFVPIDARTGAVHCDKKDAEDLNLLKIDALGLIQLSIFQDALSLAGLPHDYLDSIPTDDMNAIGLLNKRAYAGVFQFNGAALQSVANTIIFDQLEDIVAVTALARPGPLASKGTDEWEYRKMGKRPITYPHPAFEPILKSSLGVVAYQEQVMSICRDIGGMSWDEVTFLRKAMSKSLGKEFFSKYGESFKAGALRLGMQSAAIDKLWDDLCSYGSWAFNRSHAVAYGLVSYYCLWLKYHYPLEFAAATLNHEKSADAKIAFLRELSFEGIGYVAVDAENSTDKWVVGTVDNRRSLIGPLLSVKGFGPKLAKQVMSARERGEPIPERARKLLTNPITELDTLFPIRDRIKTLCPDLRDRNIFTEPTLVNKVLAMEGDEVVLVIGNIVKIQPRNDNEPIKVAKRGGQIRTGPTDTLNLWIRDDTAQIFCYIDRYKFDKIARSVLARGKAGSVIYAVKGKKFGDSTFSGIQIDNIRFLGETK